MDRMERITEQWARIWPELDTSDMAPIGRILLTARMLELRMESAFAPFGLNRGEFDVLVSLLRAGPPNTLTPTALSGALLLSTSAMTNRIDRLERTGLVRREHDSIDRRGIRVCLTDEGRSAAERTMLAYCRSASELLSPLLPSEREQLSDLLRQLLVDLEAAGATGTDRVRGRS